MLEKVIRDHIMELELPSMASYGSTVAVFEQQAPDDTDSGWGTSQYGRVIYDLSMRDDQERKVSGQLRVMTAYGNTEDGKGYENLRDAVDKLTEGFDGVFLSDGDGMTIAAVWRNSETFTEQENAKTQKEGSVSDTEVFGTILYFDVYAFPAQLYPPLDPVKSLAKVLQETWPDANVINLGTYDTEGILTPTDEQPIVYVRLTGLAPGRFPSIHACTWHMATLRVHIVAGTDNQQKAMAVALIHAVAEQERFRMEDGSPFFVSQTRYDPANDILRDGRVTIIGQYGVLRNMEETEVMNNISIKGLI